MSQHKTAEDKFLDEVYAASELAKGTNNRALEHQVLELILESFDTHFVKSDRPKLDLPGVLERINLDKISDTEMIMFLTISIEINNPEAYKSRSRTDFYRRVKSYFKAHLSRQETNDILNGLE